MTSNFTRRQLRRLPALLLCAVGAATLMAQCARLGWFPELASHFRPQYLLALLILLPAFVFMRRRILAMAALGLMIPNVWYVGPYLLPVIVPASVAEAAGPVVSLISLNLYYRNHRYQEVRDYLKRSDPDVLVLTELTPEWVTELRAVTSGYPFWMSIDRRTPWGLGVYSRYPLGNPQSTGLGVRGSVNVFTTVALPGGDMQLVAAHLSSPTTPRSVARRNGQLATLAGLLNTLSGTAASDRPRRLLVGDLNVTPFSPYFRDLLGRTGMQDARRVHGLLGTWPTWMAPLQVHIDHCIADPGLAVTRVARGPAVGSDHYPLEITLR